MDLDEKKREYKRNLQVLSEESERGKLKVCESIVKPLDLWNLMYEKNSREKNVIQRLNALYVNDENYTKGCANVLLE